MKKLMISTIIFLLIISFSAAFSGSGSGTSSDPFLITTESELNETRLNTTASYRLENNLTLTLWQTGNGWTSIPSFSGEFDGDGHVISNLYINRSQNNQGLFSIVSGTIKHLGLENISITAVGAQFVGGLVSTLSGTINQTYVKTGDIYASSDSGGLVGYTNSGKIYHSYSEVNMTAGTNAQIGGLTGYLSGSGNTIVNSYVRGNTSITGANTGSIIGFPFTDASTSNLYFDLNKSDNTVASGGAYGSGHGENKTTTELYSQATYNNYDFQTIWRINEGSGYAELQAFNAVIKTLNNQTVRHDQNMSFQTNCYFLEGTEYYYDNTSLFNINATGYVSDNPSQGETGSYNIEITCGDNLTNVSKTFTYTITNDAIIVTSVTITPFGAQNADDLNISWLYNDTEGDTSTDQEIKWYVNTVYNSTFDNETNISNTYTSLGESWVAGVRLYDGQTWGSYTNSSPMVIGDDTPPVIQSSSISATSGTNDDPFTVTTNVTDENTVQTVTLQVTNPNTISDNFTMSSIGGDLYEKTYTPSVDGIYSFKIFASDTSGNIASSTTSFNYTESTSTGGGGGGGGTTIIIEEAGLGVIDFGLPALIITTISTPKTIDESIVITNIGNNTITGEIALSGGIRTYLTVEYCNLNDVCGQTVNIKPNEKGIVKLTGLIDDTLGEGVEGQILIGDVDITEQPLRIAPTLAVTTTGTTPLSIEERTTTEVRKGEQTFTLDVAITRPPLYGVYSQVSETLGISELTALIITLALIMTFLLVIISQLI